MLAETFATGGKQGARTSLQRKIQALSRERLSPAKTQSHTHTPKKRCREIAPVLLIMAEPASRVGKRP